MDRSNTIIHASGICRTLTPTSTFPLPHSLYSLTLDPHQLLTVLNSSWRCIRNPHSLAPAGSHLSSHSQSLLLPCWAWLKLKTAFLQMVLFFEALDTAILQIRLQRAASSQNPAFKMACVPPLLGFFTVVDVPMGLSSLASVLESVSTVS